MAVIRRSGAGWRDVLFALLLLTPVLVLYAAHFGAVLLDPTHIGTGFIQADMPEYMASAREYMDGNHTCWMYAPPSTPDYAQKPTLVQLNLLVLSWLWRITGMDPGWLFVLYGMCAALVAIRIFMAVFDEVIPCSGAVRRLGQFLFVWGGGVLALAGAAVAASNGYRGVDLLKQSMCIDPASGIWSLNLGRALIFPNEALYHGMFFGALLLGLRGRWGATLIIAIALMWCHPFAGLQLLAVLGAWCLVEVLFAKATQMPRWFPFALAAGAAPYLYYLFIWIPANVDSALMREIRSDFDISWYSSVCGYVFVGTAVIMRFMRGPGLRALWSNAQVRLFAVMALVCLGLENHDLFTSTPHQPAHFSRGYAWSALFLLGAPWVAGLFRGRSWSASGHATRMALVACCFMFCLDNVAFFTVTSGIQLHSKYIGSWISPDAVKVMSVLQQESADRPLVVSDDNSLSQLVCVYTPLRSYYGHVLEHERAALKQSQSAFFAGRLTDPRLAGNLIVVATKADQPDFTPNGDARSIHENGTYRVWRVQPR